ncbi:MAG: alpha/beta hydrolase, partial [Ferruginibacter sp.]
MFSTGGNNKLKPVLIFVHGGAWNSGNKSLYNFFGNRMARKGIVTVIPDYTKSPKANYNQMATEIAAAVLWTKKNITAYGGDSNRIFISGHSAGGHLAALITIKKEYFEKLQIHNPVKGLILIDAAGLDMYGYLKEENFEEGNTYLKTFSANPATWKAASPLYFLHKDMPPMLIYRGGKTYPSILKSNEKFIDSLQKVNANFTYHVQPGKKHIPMIL